MSAELYLDLLERIVTNTIYCDPAQPNKWIPGDGFDYNARVNGTDWPLTAHTMIGLKRVRNLRSILTEVMEEGIPGDFIETGVWRGGACIFARGFFKAYEQDDRCVWLADSFEGIPDTSKSGHVLDQQMSLHESNQVLAVSEEEVKENFRKYGLLDAQVKFLPGWFKDTLPRAKISQLAVIRLDGDLYESTRDALESLYPKLSAGGYVIVDDYIIPACKQAVSDFRKRYGIDEILVKIDDHSSYWKKRETNHGGAAPSL
jgi:hypothetical protein